MKHFLCSILLIYFAARSHAQDVELSVETGHSSAIQTIAFSPGDDLIASGGSDNKIILWDFLSSKQSDVLLGHTAPITDLEFHPTEKILVSSSLDSTVKFWNFNSGELLLTLSYKYPIEDMSIAPNGKEIALAGKEILLMKFPEKVNIQTFKEEENYTRFQDYPPTHLPIYPKTTFTSVNYNTAGTMLAFGGRNEDLAYVINLSEKSMLRKITASFTDCTFDQLSGNLIYSTEQGIGAETSLSIREKKSTSTDWMLNSFNAVQSNNSYLFFANDLGEIRVIDRKNFAEFKILKSARSSINTLAISNNNSFLAAGGDDGRIVTWDLNTFQAIKFMEGSVSQINAIAFSKDGSEILIGYQDGSLRKTNLFSNQSLLNSPQSNSQIISNRLCWSVYQIISFEKDSAVFTMHRKRYDIEQESTFDKITEFTVVWHFKDNLLTLVEHENPTGKAAEYIADRKMGISHPVEFLLNPALRYADDNDQLYSVNTDGLHVSIFKGKSLHPTKLQGQHTDQITSLAVNNTYRFFATAGWDGMIRFRDLETGKLLTTFGPFSGGQFIYINPDGYYFSSKKALDYVGFKINERLYSFDQFDLIYNRPDLVASYLPYYDELYVEAYQKAYLKRLKKLGLTEADLKTDQAVPTISYKRNLDQLLLSGSIKLQVNCKDSLHELDKLHIRVNGVPEYGRFGKSISGHSFSDSIEIELNPGTNYIQLYCTNKNGIASLKESFSVEAHKKDVGSDLFLVSIGVSKYNESQYDLSFARKDAEDMVRYFSRPFGPFTQIKTKLLVDSMVTLSAVNELKTFLSEPKPNDVVMVFIAGHGVLDLKLDYYLATYDMDFKNPSAKGIPYELFDELLDKTKSRKKVLFIDACHSGEIDKDAVIGSEIIETEQGDIKFRSAGININYADGGNSLEMAKSLFADMRLNNGTTVISSAGGTEFAIESENWRNGAFTYCLLYGLSSGAADLNKNKVILLSELQEYLLFQVNKLTEGAQTPTSRVENLNNDFRIK